MNLYPLPKFLPLLLMPLLALQAEPNFRRDSKLNRGPSRAIGPGQGKNRLAKDSESASPDVDIPEPSAVPASYYTTPLNVTLPVDTAILVVLTQDLSSNMASGTQFAGVLKTNLMDGDSLVAPAGTEVFGTVQAKKANRIAGKSELELALTGISIKNVLHPMETSSFEQQGKGSLGKTAVTTGAGAAAGHAFGGEDGTTQGMVAGAGVGLLKKGEEVELPKGTLLQFKLSRELVIQEKESSTQAEAAGESSEADQQGAAPELQERLRKRMESN